MNSIKSLITEKEKGCGKCLCLHPNRTNYIRCGDTTGRKIFCDKCSGEIEGMKQCQEIQDAREQEILNILKIDNFRMFGFTEEAVNQLCNDDDRTSIIIETLEEVKKKLSQVVGK
jgi:hypothetical protein